VGRYRELERSTHGFRLLPEGGAAVLPFPLPTPLPGSSRGLLAQEEEGTDYACGGVCC
jgi:hypothetical protein